MISIIIPSFNNLDYLKLAIESIKKNSNLPNEIILHINEGTDGTLDFVKKNNYKFSYSEINDGICIGCNKAASISKYDLILYAHDDMCFCPNWDDVLIKEVKSIGHNSFYLSGTMIEPNSAHISFDCGDTPVNFDESKLIDNLHNLNFYDHQGSHFAPHLVEKKLWDTVGGFSEEFNPGMASDPDFNMKLWNKGVRIFKGINDFKVYHFSSTTTRKKINFKRNKGDITFIKKWGFSHKFFKKYYLRSKSLYIEPLKEPDKNLFYYFDLFLCKLKIIFLIFLTRR